MNKSDVFSWNLTTVINYINNGEFNFSENVNISNENKLCLIDSIIKGYDIGHISLLGHQKNIKIIDGYKRLLILKQVFTEFENTVIFYDVIHNDLVYKDVNYKEYGLVPIYLLYNTINLRPYLIEMFGHNLDYDSFTSKYEMSLYDNLDKITSNLWDYGIVIRTYHILSLSDNDIDEIKHRDNLKL